MASFITVAIDNQKVQLPAGATVLDAAEKLGLEIPTLCYLRPFEPSTSCLVCIVKDRRSGMLFPSCGMRAVEGMDLESETPEVHQVRRTALELLLSEHVGDCRAPCDFACPAHMDIPLMLEQISRDQLREAIATVKEDIALPAILGRVCPKPCEKGCRRKDADDPVAICDMKRHVADLDLASEDPYVPPLPEDSGRRVTVVGAGPAGLAAAYYLRRYGHAVTLLESNSVLGGRLRCNPDAQLLPPNVLEGEIQQILRLGIQVRMDSATKNKEELDRLCGTCDAVLLACGAVDRQQVERLGLKPDRKGIEVNRETYQTSRPGVFAAGNALRTKGLVVRSAADGKEAAAAIDRFLGGQTDLGPGPSFASRIGRLQDGELDRMIAEVCAEPGCGAAMDEPETKDEAASLSERCLRCTCANHGNCKLERYAEMYGANPNRFPRQRQSFDVVGRPSSIQFEPGKCIKCELCIKIAQHAREPLGLTFVGRGFDVRLQVPFDRSLDEGLSLVAAECVAACPTAALSFGRRRTSELVSLTLEVETLRK